MQHTMPPAEMDAFGQKLEDFAAKLSDNERTLFKQMFLIDRDRLSDKALDGVSGGLSLSRLTVFHGFQFNQIAPKLNASFFKFLCW